MSAGWQHTHVFELTLPLLQVNDRSQAGDHDSEICVCIDDRDLVESKMNGKPYMASSFASSFRRGRKYNAVRDVHGPGTHTCATAVFLQHLGLMKPQECTPEDAASFPTDAMRPAPAENPTFTEELVEDPLSELLEQVWKEQAATNTSVYDDVFRVVPSDKVRSWKEYDEFFPKPPIKTGHIADPSFDLAWIKQRLGQVKGALVQMPLHFLENEDLEKGAMSAEVNAMTLDIYL